AAHPPPCDLPPFPTRRSSDLAGGGPETARRGAPLAGSQASARTARPGTGQAALSRETIAGGRWHMSDSLRIALAQLNLLVGDVRSEEHTSELQSHLNLVCRLL